MDGQFASDGLSSLESNSSRTILDLVDKLRSCGLGTVLSLPQIVVAGDQSSGKSSVLEAISGVPFPRKEGFCTQFATEVIMRPTSEQSIRASIIPSKMRPKEEQDSLCRFDKSADFVSGLSSVFEEATIAMGLTESEDQGSSQKSSITRDVLSIQISGPGLPQLTLVDLPGLIHTSNDRQSQMDVDMIRDLVTDYIKDPRSIILAVVSAKNDIANQIILHKCRSVDPDGHRTLGVITKPDFLKPGSENEQKWLSLALNQNIKFERGWHMLKNRSEDEMHLSSAERDAREEHFFSTGSYANLPKELKGVESFSTRLCDLLNEHIHAELPELQSELEIELKASEQKLADLGQRRSNMFEKKQYLTEVSMKMHDLLKMALHGPYDDSFFTITDHDKSIDEGDNVKRLRAAVQHRNLDFAKCMRLTGHKYNIPRRAKADLDDESEVEEIVINGHVTGSEDDTPVSEDERPLPRATADSDTASPETYRPSSMTRKQAIKWVAKRLEFSRGQELPGTYNPLLVSDIFWEQSKPWEALASRHVKKVASMCRTVVTLMLDKVVGASEVRLRLMANKVEPFLENALQASLDELDRIVEDQQRHPMTYNHYFTTNLQKIRQSRQFDSVQSIIKKATGEYTLKHRDGGWFQAKMIDPDVIKPLLSGAIEQDMDLVSAEDALDALIAYYKVRQALFIAGADH